MRKSLWYLPSLAVSLSLIIGPLLRNGMFLDGLVYTNIAKNLSEGIGSIWAPLVHRKGEIFYDHPVFLPWVESLFFRLLGDGLHTEDCYNFIIFALTVLVLYKIWGTLVDPKRQWLFFFPLLLWVLNQEVQLRYPNTLLECGTALIVLTTFYFFIKTNNKAPFLSYFMIGLGTVFAFSSKGPFGLFLLGIPFLYTLVKLKRWSISSLVIPVLSSSVIYGLLVIVTPEAHDFVLQYLDRQVLAAIKGQRVENIAETRFDFLIWLIALNAPAICISGLTRLIKVNNTEKESENLKPDAWLMLLIGASAIIPLAISIKQAAYYQLVGLPFLILGISLFLVPRVERLVEIVNTKRRLHRILTSLFIVGVLLSSFVALSMIGKTDKRDEHIVDVVEKLGTVFKGLEVRDYNLKLSGDIASAASISYRLTGYLARYQNVHLNQTGEEPYSLVIQHGGKFDTPPDLIKIFEESNVIILGPKKQ
jgi:hypothetical protein